MLSDHDPALTGGVASVVGGTDGGVVVVAVAPMDMPPTVGWV